MKRTVFKLSLVMILLSLSVFLTAQVQVSGRVLGNDAPDGLVGATVRLVGTIDNYEVETLNNGNFSFPGVLGSQTGLNYRLTISYEGYQTHRRQVLVRNTPINLGNIIINEYAYPPTGVIAEESEDEDAVIVRWNEPVEWTERWFHWDSGLNQAGIGTGGAYQFSVAARFTPLHLNQMGTVGLYVTSVRFIPFEATATYTIKVWRGGSGEPLNPGQEVASQAVNQFNVQQWNEIELTNPVFIDGTQEIWFGYHVNTPTGFPAACDGGPAIDGFGNLIRWGVNWTTILELNNELNYNWNVQAFAGVLRGERSIALIPENLNDSQQDSYDSSLINIDEVPPLMAKYRDQNNNSMLSSNNTSRANRLSGRDTFKEENRELEGYRIFRFHTLFFEYPDEWVELATVTDTIYSDTTWVDIDEGIYRYAVQAVYTNDVFSPIAISDEVSSLPAEFAGGTGSIVDPWLIESAHNFNSMRYYLGNEHNDKYYRQTASIDLGTFPWTFASGWIPIGSSATNSFQGTYDGGDFTISNLTINRAGLHQGLFGYTSGAEIENVVLEDVNVLGGNYTGGLVGYAANLTIIRDCSVKGSVSGASNVGGLVGTNFNSTVRGSSSEADVYGSSSQVGGLVGNNNQGGKVIESFASGSVRGASFVGGLVGYNQGIRDEDCGTLIDRSFSSGFVTGTSNWVGGLTGRTFGSTIRDCYSSATVSAFQAFAGSLIGQHCCSSALINSYAVGYTTSTAGSVGGLMGQQQTSTTESSYWNTESTTQNIAPQGTARNTAQMVQQNTFVNWNFDNIWIISEGTSYPYFIWQNEPWQHNIPGPFGLTANAGDAVVNLTWQAPPLGNVLGYKVYRDGVLINPEQLAPQNQYSDTTVANFFTYTYNVSAVLQGDVESAFSNPASATPFVFEDGTGTVDDPYIITNPGQLSIIRFNLASHFKLANNIDLGVEPWNSGEGWHPIGTSGQPFTGSLDGDGYRILNLKIERVNLDYQGLFGFIQIAVIKNIGMENVDISARNYTGAITGYNRAGSISNSYVTGKVTGSVYTGGFVGYQFQMPNSITNSFNAADVHCNSTSGYVGGFVGYLNTGSIENSFSIGRVSLVGSTGYVGPLIGRPWGEVAISNCFWNSETSGTNISPAGGEGKTTLELIEQETFTDWNFNDIWAIGFENEATYPYLRLFGDPRPINYPNLIPPRNLYASAEEDGQINLTWTAPSYGNPTQYRIYRDRVFVDDVDVVFHQYADMNVGNFALYEYTITAVYGEAESNHSNPASVSAVPGGYAGGIGTIDDPYQVSTSRHLQNVRYNPFSHFIQTEDISLADVANWIPIGSSGVSDRFIGSYDGSGFLITNMTIINPAGDYLGLFGYVGYGVGATLKNITLRNISVSGRNHVGGLAGRVGDNSTIDHCYASGSVISVGSYTGGLVGFNHTSNISNSYSSGSVTAATNFVGGLIGYNSGSMIDNCFSTSVLQGGRYVGGLIGYHNGTVTDSFARGAITGTISEIGGFIGNTVAGNVRNSYSTGRVSAPQDAENVGGFIGLHSSGTVTDSYWDTLTSATNISAAGNARNTDQMTYPYAADTYVNWNFEDLWEEDTGGQINHGYPYLHWHPIVVSPNPNYAENPFPINQATNVTRNIEEVRWSYNEHILFTNPVGFRVYMNTTGVFGGNDPFAWVPYVDGQVNYSTAEIFPQQFVYGRLYYWRVVPTTIDPNGREADNRRRSGEEERSSLLTRGDAQNCPTWRFTIQNSTNPTVARNPQPTNNAVNVPLNLPAVGWAYMVNNAFANPIGFRVYMNTTGEFTAEDDFVWVAYNQQQVNYSTTDIIPERLDFNTTYYWKVVPTTNNPNQRISGDVSNTRRRALPSIRDTETLSSRGDAEDVPIWNFTSIGSDPNPHSAENPQPEHLAAGISLGLPYVSWDYEPVLGYALPAGFRVYMNSTGGFPAGAPFVWVDYVENQETYTCADIIPLVLDPNVMYYWRVVPTTVVPNALLSGRELRRIEEQAERESNLLQRGDAPNTPIWRFTTGTTNTEEEFTIPVTALGRNYPNPFNPETVISFTLSEADEVSIEIFNIKGEKIITLVNDFHSKGYHQIVWNGRDENNRLVSSGVYYYRMKSGSYTSTNKMILMK